MTPYGPRVGPEVVIQCQVCENFALGPIGTAFVQLLDAVYRNSEYRARRLAEIRRNTAAFGRFLRADLPRLLGERKRLAREKEEKERREAELRRQHRLELQRQARRRVGLQNMTPTDFEKAVGSLYIALGWRVFRTPGSGDRGIDLVLKKEGENAAVQCKRYKKPVGEPYVREFYGSFIDEFDRGVFVTSSSFSPAAKDWAAKRKPLSLVDGSELAALMVKHRPPLLSEFEKWQV